MDAEKICRLCGYKLYKPKNIYATPGLFGKISRYTDLQIRQGDGFPNSICEMCDLKLQMADNFRLEVNKADEKMTESLFQKVPERRSAFVTVKRETNKVTEWLEADRHLVIRPGQNKRRTRIRRERMRLSERRPWHPQTSPPDIRSKRSLMCSYETARSLVVSYKALIDRCDFESYVEEFAVPFPDNDSDSGDEDVRPAAARCRPLQESCGTPDEQTTRTPVNHAVSVQQDVAINSLSHTDPLNLLKIKSIRPLRDDENTSDSSIENHEFHFDSKSATSSRVDYQTSDTSDVESSEEEGTRTLSSTSSKVSVKIIKQQPVTFAVPSLIRTRKSDSGNQTGDRDVTESLMSDAKCPVCAKLCVNRFGLGVHMRTHMSSKCQICSAPTPTKDKFKEHMQCHMPSSATSSVQCGICKNIFKTRMGLSVHMRIHNGSTVPTEKECPHCKKVFATYRGFKIHLAKSHSGYETG